ncbi:MAG: hypothetical protein K2P93_05240 [Alphaproteobacteria bacterium]|nr:hypothetical protein [Alphaproteobacteria bacterium]
MSFTHKRRGRPPHTRLEVDIGTDEIQKKRTLLLKEGANQDVRFAESLLGVLYAYQVISRPLYDAGCFFGELGYRYEACLGYTFRKRVSHLTQVGGGSLGGGGSSLAETYEEKQIRAWRSALGALKGAGVRPYHAVLKIVFYDQDLYMGISLRSLLKERESLQKGLARLDLHFKGELRGGRDTPYDRV